MDENEFATDEATQWLRERDADTSIAYYRDMIGKYNGWEAEWYEDEDRLKEFYQGFQADSGVTSELDDLGEVDDSQRAEWLMGATGAMHQAPEFDENYGMWYRYNNITGEYWWHQGEADQPPEPGSEEWVDQGTADQIMQEWQAGQASQEEAATGSPAATWDENWNMFYRLNDDGVYQYAFSTTSDANGEPRETWYSYEDVPSTDPEAPEVEAPIPEAAEAEAPVAAEEATAAGLTTESTVQLLPEEQEAAGELTAQLEKDVDADPEVLNRILGEMIHEEIEKMKGEEVPV
jgi:hypothetical protein